MRAPPPASSVHELVMRGRRTTKGPRRPFLFTLFAVHFTATGLIPRVLLRTPMTPRQSVPVASLSSLDSTPTRQTLLAFHILRRRNIQEFGGRGELHVIKKFII
uniref:Uncharacterized protein n=1 Tax=Plectus sambesii TaxID=2011161 RepID=A0A914WVW8_9BILA